MPLLVACCLLLGEPALSRVVLSREDAEGPPGDDRVGGGDDLSGSFALLRLRSSSDNEVVHCSRLNVTLSIDEELLARARELAERRGVSLDQMISEYLQELAAERTSEAVVAELTALWNESSGNSGERPWTRGELHERSGVR